MSLKQVIKSILPAQLKNIAGDLSTKRRVRSFASKKPIYKYHCPACNYFVRHFNPLSAHYNENLKKYGFAYNLENAETLNIEQYTCPVCGISDRDRLYILYFKKKLDPSKNYKLVDFAPAEPLARWLKKQKNISYRSADLFMDGVDDKVDLQHMNIYEENKFDIFICSHILEHVDDDRQAMRELYRILKPGGFGIAMVPIFNGVMDTSEDPSLKDIPSRWRQFGQDDHIRIYAKNDFVSRLQHSGFTVKEYGLNYFGADLFKKSGIAEKSVLYIVEK
jgi:SAM-dependent methyltransferase